MARNFAAGLSERVTVSIGAGGITNPMTVLALIRKSSDGVQRPIISTGLTTPNATSFLTSATNTLQMFWGTGAIQVSPTITVTVADGWVLVGASKGTGTIQTRFYKCLFNEPASYFNEISSTTVANTSTQQTSMFLGSDSSTGFFDGDIAIAGVWNASLLDADITKLALTYKGSDWLTLPSAAPVALWQLNQSVAAGVNDLTAGGANQTSVSGTRPTLDPALSVIRAPVYLPFPPRY